MIVRGAISMPVVGRARPRASKRAWRPLASPKAAREADHQDQHADATNPSPRTRAQHLRRDAPSERTSRTPSAERR